MFHWLRKLFVRDFPEPKAHNLPIEELFRFYHRKLNDRWRAECQIIIYRMDPAKAPFKSLLKLDRLESFYQLTGRIEYASGNKDEILMPPTEWWAQSDMPKPWTATFLVRIQRTWKTQYGTKTKEICIATFEIEL